MSISTNITTTTITPPRRRNLSALATQTLDVILRLSLMILLPCYATTFWTRVTIGGGVALLIGRCVLPHLIRVFVFWLRQSSSLLRRLTTTSSTTPTTLLCQPADNVFVLTSQAAHRDSLSSTMDSDPAPPRRKPRPASIATPISFDDVLASAAPNSPIRPAPQERIGSPTSPTSPTKQDRHPLLPAPSRTRNGSLVDAARENKRLSLTFPVQPFNAPSSRQSPVSRPSSWYNSPIASPELVPSPTEPMNFLTKLAAQERRVLELKEALRQAEQELEKLKKDWAKEEAVKKRQDVRKLQQLQPLSVLPLPSDMLDDDSDGSSEWLQREMERRKAILSGMKTSNRKVFSGSKHTRTLSLLSPERGHFPQPFSQPPDVRRSLDQSRRSALVRSSTTPDIAAAAVAESAEEQDYEAGSAPKDVLFKTGKQMMSDMKEGFMTFFEDIRQATVGEEGVSATRTRITESGNKGRTAARIGNRSPAGKPPLKPNQAMNATKHTPDSARSPDLQADIGSSFWQEHGMAEAKTRQTPRVARPKLNQRHTVSTPRAPKDLDDAWDTWGTPVSAKHAQSDSGSSSQSRTGASITAHSTPDRASSRRKSSASSADRTLTPRSSLDTARNSVGAETNRDAIPWPVLQKLSPTNLRRTASHLMSEWEKSLTPPTADESDAVSTASSSLAYPAPAGALKEKRAE